MLGSLTACFKPQSPQSVSNPVGPSTATVEQLSLAGTIIDHLYHDYRYPFYATIPQTWKVEIGQDASNLRLRIIEKGAKLAIEVWHYKQDFAAGPSRPSCHWKFIDVGLYGVRKQKHRQQVATCVPNDPNYPYIFAYIQKRSTGTWIFEVHAHSSTLLSSKGKGEHILKGFYWQSGGDKVPVIRQIN